MRHGYKNYTHVGIRIFSQTTSMTNRRYTRAHAHIPITLNFNSANGQISTSLALNLNESPYNIDCCNLNSFVRFCCDCFVPPILFCFVLFNLNVGHRSNRIKRATISFWIELSPVTLIYRHYPATMSTINARGETIIHINRNSNSNSSSQLLYAHYAANAGFANRSICIHSYMSPYKMN